MSKHKKINLRVEKGMFIPAGRAEIEALRERNYKTGDIVQAVITKPRNPQFNGLVHRIGWLCISHIPAFAEFESGHKVLKRLQLEGNIACEEIKLHNGDIGLIPESLSYENMDQHEFQEVSKQFCRFIAAEYWPEMDEESISEMAESFVEE